MGGNMSSRAVYYYHRDRSILRLYDYYQSSKLAVRPHSVENQPIFMEIRSYPEGKKIKISFYSCNLIKNPIDIGIWSRPIFNEVIQFPSTFCELKYKKSPKR